jgi:hypothetical protein
VDLEDVPSLVRGTYFIPMVAGTMEVSCGEDLGVCSAQLLCLSNSDTSRFCLIHAILDLLEQSFNGLMGIPCLAHVIKVVLQVYCSDADIRQKEVFMYFSCSGVIKSNYIIVHNFKIHGFTYRYNLLFQSLLHSSPFLKVITASSQWCHSASS